MCKLHVRKYQVSQDLITIPRFYHYATLERCNSKACNCSYKWIKSSKNHLIYHPMLSFYVSLWSAPIFSKVSFFLRRGIQLALTQGNCVVLFTPSVIYARHLPWDLGRVFGKNCTSKGFSSSRGCANININVNRSMEEYKNKLHIKVHKIVTRFGHQAYLHKWEKNILLYDRKYY